MGVSHSLVGLLGYAIPELDLSRFLGENRFVLCKCIGFEAI